MGGDVWLATLGWLALGVPAGAVLARAGRTELALGIVPFAGWLALVIPPLVAAWTLGSLDGLASKAAISSLVIAGMVALSLRGEGPPAALRLNRVAIVVGIGLLGLGAAVNLEAGLVLAEGYPSYAWDGYQIWLLRAKVLAGVSEFPAAFYAEPQLARSQWQYPIAFPAYLAAMMKWASLELRSLHVPIAILGALIPFATFSLLLRVVSPWLAAAVVASPLAVPGLVRAHHEALADPLLVMVALAGCACAQLGSVRGDRALQVVAGAILALAVMIKNDGTFWVLACGLSCLALAWIRHRDIAGSIALGARIVLPSVAMFLVWDLTSRHLGVVNAIPFDTSEFAARLPVVIHAVAVVLLSGPGMLTVPGCIVAVVALSPGPPLARAGFAAALLALPGIYLAGIVFIQCAIYIPPPYDIEWLLETSINRLIYGVVPALLLCAVTAAALRDAMAQAAEVEGDAGL